MKRRTLRQLRAKVMPEQHHNVYVVLLNPAVGKIRKVRAENPKRDPEKPCVYVGMTGLTPEERFSNHTAGFKPAEVVTRFGLRLLPDLSSTSCAWRIDNFRLGSGFLAALPHRRVSSNFARP